MIVGLLLFGGCAVMQRSNIPFYDYGRSVGSSSVATEMTDYSQVNLGDSSSFRVAVLLPLSGKVATMGQSMKNAATMAVGDINNNNLVVQFYDTKGTGSGARIALENAVNAKSDLIIGPLLSEEVVAISDKAKSEDIPVISFSTSPSVLHEGIYSLGLLSDDQVNRIVKYAAAQGRTRLAIVLPDNKSGYNILRSAMKAARNSGISVVRIGFYAPDAMEFTDLVTAMKGRNLDFDALLIPETGNRLKAISSMFSYYDVAAPDVLFLGTSVWDNANLSKETELYGAVYPTMSLNNMSNFSQKYNELFGEKPSGLSIFAYDAVALASILAGKNARNLEDEIVRPDGYIGMSGLFRILSDGLNEHSLDVVKVTADGRKIVETAPQQFYGYPAATGNLTAYQSSGYQDMPEVYGKSAADVQNILLNVQ